jgi:cytidine deaminase
MLAPASRLLESAWEARNNAFVIGPTKVGCAVLSESGRIYSGCNVEHRYRSHDVHAEVNAITTMISSGDKQIVAVAIAAERERFTPCGACLDWIFQFAEPGNCMVYCQAMRSGPVTEYRLAELMPYYPK